MGEVKEQCVYDKMNAKPGVPLRDSKGNSATVQQRFKPDGTAVPPGGFGGTGSFVPDIIYQSADGTIEAVRDLKFPCPPGGKKEGQWKPGQKKKYQSLLGPGKGPPTLIFPI
jgi:hypothetical protein